MDKSLMLNKIMEHKGFRTKTEFANFLGISTQNLAVWFKRDTFNSNILFDRLPELNPTWLLTGEGDMLIEDANTDTDTISDTDIISVPLLPISAQGGTLNDFVVSVKESECERVISPIKGADFAMTVSGDSMAPEYPSGSQIFIKKINEQAFIEWGKVYVLDTCNGSVIKILAPSDKEGFVKCLSINEDPKYASFEVEWNDIYGVYRVLLCMSLK